MKVIFTFTISILLNCFNWGYAQIQLEITTVPTDVYANEPFSLQFKVHGSTAINRFKQPVLENLRYVGGPFQSGNQFYVNGKRMETFSVSYTVIINKPGNITIPEATIWIDNNPHSFKALNLKVHAGRRLNNSSTTKKKNPFNERDEEEWPTESSAFKKKLGDNIFMQLEVDKKRCYNGEPITASYKLYSRLQCESKLTKNPSFNGFSVTDIQISPESDVEVDTVNGKLFNVYTIRKVQLIPQQTGKLHIEKAALENHVYILPPNSNADPFQMMNDPLFSGARVHTVHLTSNAVDVEVMPLPENAPVDYNGAVGEFEFNTTMMQYVFPAHKEGKLVVEIRGTGNLQLLTPPIIEWPEELEPFESVVKDDINQTASPIVGTRQFIFPFSVKSTGKYNIPAINFHVFNPAKKQYETLHSSQISFNVIPSEENDLLLVNKQKQHSWKNNANILLTITGIMALLAVVFVFLKKKKTDKKFTVVKEVKEQRGPLHQPVVYIDPFMESKALLQTYATNTFYQTLQRELKIYLCQQLSIHAQTEASAILEALDQKGISDHVQQSLSSLLHELEMNVYAPIAVNEEPSVYLNRAEEIVNTIRLYFP